MLRQGLQQHSSKRGKNVSNYPMNQSLRSKIYTQKMPKTTQQVTHKLNIKKSKKMKIVETQQREEKKAHE